MLGAGYWLKKQAMLRGKKTALVEGNKNVNYDGLNRRVNRLAWVLREKFNLDGGDRLAILTFNCIEFVEVFFATAKLNIVLVPLNVRLSIRELEFMLEDSGARLLFIDPEFFEQGMQLKETCKIETVFWGKEYEKLLSPASENEPLVEPNVLTDSHLILYTSGTTGRPKGAELTQGNAFWNAVNMQVAVGLTKNDTTLTVLPLFHTGGIGLYLIPTLHQGGKVVIQRKFDPEETLNILEKEKVTAFFGVPAMFHAMLETGGFSAGKFVSVRNMMSGGAPLPSSLIEKYRDAGLKLLQGYGCTETSPGILAMDEDDPFTKEGSVGKPLLHCRVSLFQDDGSEVPSGMVGEIWVKGGNVMKGYWQQPEATGEAFADGWFKTGDLARKDEDGYYYIAGRKKDLIISGGENIYPAEVEDYLSGYEGIREAAVLGIPDERWGEVPVAVIVPAKESLKVDEIHDFCRKGLARYKIPRKIIFVKELPRNAAGKVLKNDLQVQIVKEAEGGELA